MGDLSVLDEFSPKDTDPVSLGDDSIRETRLATKTSMKREHYLTGVHNFPSGTLGARPAPGQSGRIYFNTDRKTFEYDTGAAWQGPADAKAQATILWHSAQQLCPNGQVTELAFDYIIDDPGGFASTQYHQIVMPANSIGIVTLNAQFVNGFGGYGGFLSIEQWDGSNWIRQAQAWITTVSMASITTLVDSRWGLQLRATLQNGSGADNYLNPVTAGIPRFGFALLGRTA